MIKLLLLTFTAALVLSGCGRSAPDAKAPSASQKASAERAAAAKCKPHLTFAERLDLPEAQMRVTDYAASDRLDRSWVNASFTLNDSALRLTESQVYSVLKRLHQRIAKTCTEIPLQKSRIFLYPEGVISGESANWIARYDSESNPSVTIHNNLLKDERTDKYACVNEVEPGRSLDIDAKLPPVRQRKIIGTWASPNFGLTMSLEQVGSKVYRVRRSPFCKSGDRGERLKVGPGKRYSVIDSSSGDYYEILSSGDLGVFDRDGRVDVLPVHFALHPAPAQATR